MTKRVVSLQVKVLVGTAVVLFATTATSLWQFQVLSHEAEQTIGSSFSGTAESIGEAVAAQFFERYGDVQAFAVNSVLKKGNPESISKTLDEYVALYGIYEVVLFVDMKGNFISANSKAPRGRSVNLKALSQRSFAGEPWFQAVVKGETSEDKEKAFSGTHFQDVHVDPISALGLGEKIWVTGFSSLVKDDNGNPIGVLTNRANFSWVEQELLTTYQTRLRKTDPGAEIMLLGKDGAVIAEMDPEKSDAEVKRDWSVLGKVKPADQGSTIAKAVMAGNSGWMLGTHTRKKVEQIGGYSPIKSKKFIENIGWRVVVRSSRDVVFANINREKMRAFLAALGLAGIFLLAGWVWTRGLAGELGKLTSRLSELAHSNSKSSDDLDRTAQTVSTASTEQSAAVQETVASMSEMRSMIAQTSQHVQECQRLSEAVKEKTRTGNEIVNHMAQSMQELTDSTQQMQSLVNIIAEINSKTKVINDIVFKTQLLSFNASIEAARAGQHGRGFAVVAEEVGNLAQMSGKAAKEIETLLQESQKSVSQTIGTVNERVDEGRSITEETLTRFREIAASVDQIAEKVASIQQATREQEVGIDQTAKAMEQMDIATQSNAAVSGETSTLAKDLNWSSQELRRLILETQVLILGSSSGSKTEAATEPQIADREPRSAVQASIPAAVEREVFDAKASLSDIKSRLAKKPKGLRKPKGYGLSSDDESFKSTGS